MNRRSLLGAGLGLASTSLASPALAQRDTSSWLIEMTPKQKRGDTFVIVLSGDGGWRDLDRSIGRIMRDRGVPVLGFDCLNWFWKRRSPQEIATELDRIIALYAEKWQTPKVGLVGYSFGADVMPFAWNRMTAESKARVVLISLLAFAKEAAFEIKVGDFIGFSRPSAVPTGPEVPGMPAELIQCTYGSDEEKETACKVFEGTPAQIVRTRGGHHFDENYTALAERILARLPRPQP
ncbi:virulence factor family protein [Roseomonas sp. 18066]|uniref:virulence factor family protein n=1 Tax=Roseomonas sp. 18066 TaxID=2681412 RepID=UPI00135C430F|nr:AcvB/VirJ family lysyl-phosphatidylglycerol hydrolase [Roseomonas sp. 18066]